MSAFVIANFVGMLISYRLSRQWTFKHRPPQHADGGRTAYFVINMSTMVIPMATLWMSRNWLGLDDPVSDNLSGVVIGQLLGQVARFYLFRTYVFPRPAHLDPFRPWAGNEAGTGYGRGGHRDVHEWPSSAIRSRSSGRLSPTTLWWSPSMPVTKAPPRPSTVNAPATCSGSPVAT